MIGKKRLMKTIIKDEYDSVLLQNMAIVIMLETLFKNSFVKSDYFKGLDFVNNAYKQILEDIDLNNTSILILMLFLLLCQINELENNSVIFDYSEINSFIKSKMISFETDAEHLNFEFNGLKYIRNSIAHYNTKFNSQGEKMEVIFSSNIYIKIEGLEKKQMRKIAFSLYSEDVGTIIDSLFSKVEIYINKKYFENCN